MADSNSDNKQPWLVPVIVAVVGAISTVAVAWISKLPSQTTTSLSSQSFQVSSPTIILGNYTVQGRNPNDSSSYSGEATISQDGSKYEIAWNIEGRQRFYGTGILDERLLKVKWEGGSVTYIIRDNGRILDGTWANGMGSDILTLISDHK